MATIKFTTNLRRFYPDLNTIHSTQSSLKLVLADIESSYPGLRSYIVDEQNTIRDHVNIFVNNKIIRNKADLSMTIAHDDEVYIMQALSGG